MEKARLVADLTDHRANLKDGEECPLCGSLEHPAVDGQPTSSLATLQNQWTESKRKLTELKTKQQTQSEQLALAKAAFDNQQKDIKNDQDRLVKNERTLAEHAHNFELSADEASNLTAAKATAETQLKRFKERMTQIEELRSSVQTHEQAVQQSLGKQKLLAQTLESSQSNLREVKAQQLELTQRLEKANIDVQNLTRQVNELLKPFDLTTPDAKAIETFQQSLDQRSRAFQTQTTKLAALQSQLTDSQQVAKELERDQQETANRLAQVETWANEDALRSVALPAAEDIRKVTDWANATELMEELASLRAAWQQAVGREQDRKGAAAELHKALTVASAAFLAKAVQGGFESVEQLQSKLLSDEAAAKIADDLELQKKQVNKTLGQLEQVETTLSSLQEKSAPDEKRLTDLKAEVEQAETDAGLKQKELTTIENALQTDQQQREQQAEVQKELQDERQQLATWQRLNEIMGSADGKKFRTFAQGISLDLVIRQANQHLTELSKRYRLQRRAADSLGLEICDLHQANALRPMESLSGGESFVVSLALALGLSDLAGQSVRIDSLFIDEGFGTLDPETLDMAVAALERLQANNKTIGVISHVELLKERITTQIQVRPTAGGISELKIVA